MKTPILDYCKMILGKVSFSANLFEKELKKAIKQLLGKDIYLLKEWCLKKFGKVYKRIIIRSFASETGKTSIQVA